MEGIVCPPHFAPSANAAAGKSPSPQQCSHYRKKRKSITIATKSNQPRPPQPAIIPLPMYLLVSPDHLRVVHGVVEVIPDVVNHRVELVVVVRKFLVLPPKLRGLTVNVHLRRRSLCLFQSRCELCSKSVFKPNVSMKKGNSKRTGWCCSSVRDSHKLNLHLPNLHYFRPR